MPAHPNFDLPVLPVSVSIALFPSLKKSEEKKTEDKPWDFAIFKEYLAALKDSSDKDFLLGVAQLESGSDQEEQTLLEQAEVISKNEKRVKYLLSAILGARLNAIKKLHKRPPKNEDEGSFYLAETHKRIQFMIRIEQLLKPKIRSEALAQEHCQFLAAFVEDIKINLTNMTEHVRPPNAIQIALFEQNQIGVGVFLDSAIIRAQQNHISEKAQLFNMIIFLASYNEKIACLRSELRQSQLSTQIAGKNKENMRLRQSEKALDTALYHAQAELAGLKETLAYFLRNPNSQCLYPFPVEPPYPVVVAPFDPSLLNYPPPPITFNPNFRNPSFCPVVDLTSQTSTPLPLPVLEAYKPS